MNYRPTKMTITTTYHRERDIPKEGTMFDRDRFLASDHEARLLAEADGRRLASIARSATTARPVHVVANVRHALAHGLMSWAARVMPESDPCAAATPRTA